MTDPASDRLNDRQTSVLRVVHTLLRRNGAWPTFDELDREVDQELSDDVVAVLITLPAGVAFFDPHHHRQGEVALLASGLLQLFGPEAEQDLAGFWELLQLAIGVERSFQPNSHMDEPRVDGDAAQARLRLGGQLLTSEAARRAFLVLRAEGLATSCQGPDANGKWSFTVDRSIRRWRATPNVAEYVAQRTAERSKPATPSSARATPPAVFVSFADRDRTLAVAVTDFLRASCNLAEGDVFLTARPGELEPGTYFVEAVRRALDRAAMSILLLTPAYYESRFCLAELGAAWIAQGRCVPLLVPPATFADLEGVQLGQQGLRLDRGDDLDALRDLVGEVMRGRASTAEWNRHRDRFLNDWDGTLRATVAKHASVPAPQHEALSKRTKQLEQQLHDIEQENERRRHFAAQLKADNERLRSGGSVSEPPPELTPGNEASQAIAVALTTIEHARDAMQKLPDIAREALYMHYSAKRPISVGGSEDSLDPDEAQFQVREGYLTWDPEGGGLLWPRFDHPDVEAAKSALDRVRSEAFSGNSFEEKAKADAVMRPVLKERFSIDDAQFELAPVWRALDFV